MNEFEVILPRRVIPQPTPFVYEHGDCGACVLGGILGCSIADVYAKWRDDGKVHCLSRWDMLTALRRAAATHAIKRACESTPIFVCSHTEHFMGWGMPSWTMCSGWIEHAVMAVESGHYGIAQVSHSKGGPFSGLDHWALIVGARFRWIASGDDGSRHGQHEILLSDSSRSGVAEEWIEAGDFLRTRGGYDTFWVKP